VRETAQTGGRLAAATVCGLLVAAALLLLVAGCGGGENGEVTPSATVTATPDFSAAEARLREMVLQQEDLLEGFGRGEEDFVTNEEASANSPDPAGQLAKLNEWGRVLGMEVIFEPEADVARDSGIYLVDSTASIYESAEGAGAAFGEEAEIARSADWATLFGAVLEVEVEERRVAPLTEEMLWLRITGRAELEEGVEQVLATDLVLFRQGILRGGVMIGSLESPASTEAIDEMVRAQAERLIEVAD
jgi:hypothetical protein